MAAFLPRFSSLCPAFSLDFYFPQVWFSSDPFYCISSWLVPPFFIYSLGTKLTLKRLVAAKHTKFFSFHYLFKMFIAFRQFFFLFFGSGNFEEMNILGNLVKFFFLFFFYIFFPYIFFFYCRVMERHGWHEVEETGRGTSFGTFLWWISFLYSFCSIFFFFGAKFKYLYFSFNSTLTIPHLYALVITRSNCD